MNLIIFDLETTGLSPYKNEIIQIAAVKVKAGAWDQTEAFDTYVRPEKQVPSFITRLTGIRQDQVRNAPSPTQALMNFTQFVGPDATLIAHNGMRFDMPFIREVCIRHELPMRETKFVDSRSLSKEVWGAGKHGLDLIMERLGMNADNVRRHDARGDVQLLLEAVRRMWGHLCPDYSSVPVPIKSGLIPQLSIEG